MALSTLEKARTRYHLGYMGVGMAGSLTFGLPRPGQTMFMVEIAMQQILPEHEGMLRDLITKCDLIEEKMFAATDRMSATRLGEISLRQDETDALEREYVRWAQRLADVLGVPLYYWSSKFRGGVTNGSIPVRS